MTLNAGVPPEVLEPDGSDRDERSYGRGLLDAVETDPGRGRGDGHGLGHPGPDGVLLLPAVEALPHGRAHLSTGGIRESADGDQVPGRP